MAPISAVTGCSLLFICLFFIHVSVTFFNFSNIIREKIIIEQKKAAKKTKRTKKTMKEEEKEEEEEEEEGKILFLTLRGLVCNYCCIALLLHLLDIKSFVDNDSGA